MMGKSQKLSKGRPMGFVPDYRHAVETVGESEVFASPAHIDSEDSCVPNPNPKSASLNPERSKGFNIPLQFFSLSKLSLSERNDLQTRLRGELERVRTVQKRAQTRPIMQNSAQKAPRLDRPNPNPPKSLKSIPAQVPVPVPKPQISAMLMKQCEQLLKRLMTHQYSWVFNTPVDVIKLNIPDYFTVIKTPMDLGTVKNKLRTGQYCDPLGFVSDVRLTFQNAMTYNPKGNDVHTMADVMAKFFEARWKPIEKKIALDRPVIQPNEDIVVKGGSKSSKTPKSGVNRSGGNNNNNNNKTGVLPKKRKAEVAIERSAEREREPEREKIEVIKESFKRRMSDEQKIGLSRRLESIVAELPEYIIDFLKRNISTEGQNGDDEIEIDIDSLGDETLFELEGLLDEFMREKEKQAQQDQAKNEQYENLNESGLSNSSMHEAKGQELVEEVDIVGMDPPVRRSSPVVIEKETKCETSSSSSGSSASTSHDSDSSSSSGSGSDAKASSPPLNGTKDTASSDREKKSSIESKQPETESEAQLDGDKQYRAALLKGRFADTILKAREKTLDQGAKKDPEKLRREKEELERLKREAKVRLEAEARAAEAAKKQAEAEAAMRKRAQEREAARQALQQMEQTVEINEGNLFMKGDEEIIGSGFKPGSNPLEQLGLFMKEDDDEEEDEYDEEESPQNNINNDINNIISNMNVDEVEEGEID